MSDEQQFNHTLTIPIGATYRHLFVYTRNTAEDPKVFKPVDLTGCTALLQVRDAATSPTVRATLASAPGVGITLGTTDGTILLEFTPEQTQTLARGGVYDILLSFPDGSKDYAFGGAIVASLRVTRP